MVSFRDTETSIDSIISDWTRKRSPLLYCLGVTRAVNLEAKPMKLLRLTVQGLEPQFASR